VPLWRKNRNPAASGGPNKIGVDINRNQDFLWDFNTAFDPGAVNVFLASSNPAAFAEPDAFTPAAFAELLPGLERLVTGGRLAPLVLADLETGEILGGGTFRHLDSKGAIIEIGYWLYPHARGRGLATKTARALAEHAFDLGVRRVVAHVKVGNSASERVLDRAGFAREGISRSMPTADGGRIDKTVWSLLPGV
jgi:RimJ/RimL family protein N-acetyltransferase